MDVVSWMSNSVVVLRVNKLLFFIILNSLHLIAKARKRLQNYVVALSEVSHKNNYGAVILENSELHEHCVNSLSLLKITGCIRVVFFYCN